MGDVYEKTACGRQFPAGAADQSGVSLGRIDSRVDFADSAFCDRTVCKMVLDRTGTVDARHDSVDDACREVLYMGGKMRKYPRPSEKECQPVFGRTEGSIDKKLKSFADDGYHWRNLYILKGVSLWDLLKQL